MSIVDRLGGPAEIYGSRQVPHVVARTPILSALILGTSLVAALVGCSGASVPKVSDATGPSLPAASAMPVAQRSILADGKVTPAEYQLAFAAFRECVAKSGGRLRIESRDQASGAVTYATGSDVGTPDHPNLDTLEGKCYYEQFSRVEVVFTATDPTYLASMKERVRQDYQTKTRPCLVKNGVTAPENVEPGSDEANSLDSKATDLTNQGKC